MAELATLERLLKEKAKIQMYLEFIEKGEIEKLKQYLQQDINIIDTAIQAK